MWLTNQVTTFLVLFTLFLSKNSYIEGQEQVKYAVKRRSHSESLVSANNKLSFKLLNTMENGKNIFFSPFSIHSALSMLNEGAKGVTSQEIRDVLGYDITGVNSNTTSRDFNVLLRLIESFGPEYQLQVANALLTQSNYPVFKEFVTKISEDFKAFVKNINFETGEDSVREINNWINDATGGKIKSIIKEIKEDTKALILNAVYFKGSWENPFDEKNTENIIFYNNGINPVNSPIMIREISKCMYTRNTEEGFHAVSLPYKGNDVEMIIILPLPKYTINNIRLSNEKMEEIISSMRNFKVIVKLPKFTIEYFRELKEDLITLGMKQAFTNFANLSGINEDKRLFVKSVLHKAVIEVNERGSVATGTTAVIVGTRISPVLFICDHPFLFVIRDRRTRMNLFIGQINQL
ncbi:serpin B3-like [Centruroides sculpturatus]|uniref:serpin B3-like n=1 Tax=Centruroides sculpturatus TaxID=218467 RepID=UPI000C6D88D7|nr:serpin B3-like [Centruroides sculpturatus]